MSSRRSQPLLLALYAALIAGAVGTDRAMAADSHRFTVSVNGSFAPTTTGFDSNRRFTEFAEEGTVAAHYTGDRGAGVDGGLRFAVKPHWAVAATFALLNRGTATSYTARLPHPLYLNRHRELSAQLDGLSFHEADVHVGLVYLGHAGPLDFTLFGGPSFFHVSSDLLERPRYTQEYPYDTVTLIESPVTAATAGAPGFHVGAGLGRQLNDWLAVGGQIRYGRGQVELKPKDQDPVTITAGGLQLLAGVRLGL